MNLFAQSLAVGIAGFLGSIARLLVSRLCGHLFNQPDFPVGTMVINLSGSLFLGWFMTVAGTRLVISDTTKLAVAVGFVGAYTTFSTLMFESHAQFQKGQALAGAINLLGSFLLGLIAVRFGIWLGTK